MAEDNGVEEAKAARVKMEGHLNDVQRAKAAELKEEIVLALSRQRKEPETEAQIVENNGPPPSQEKVASMTPSLAEIAPKEGTPAKTPPPLSAAPLDEHVASKDLWRVQIGAFRSADTAQEIWTSLQKRHEDLLNTHKLFTVYVDLQDKGVFHRAQIGVFEERTTAVSLCDELNSRGQSCYVVQSPS